MSSGGLAYACYLQYVAANLRGQKSSSVATFAEWLGVESAVEPVGVELERILRLSSWFIQDVTRGTAFDGVGHEHGEPVFVIESAGVVDGQSCGYASQGIVGVSKCSVGVKIAGRVAGAIEAGKGDIDASSASGVDSGIVADIGTASHFNHKSSANGDIGVGNVCGDGSKVVHAADDGGRSNVDGSVGAVSATGGFAGVDVSRGPNYERNCRNRELKKRRKAKRKAMGVDWRRDGSSCGSVRVVESCGRQSASVRFGEAPVVDSNVEFGLRRGGKRRVGDGGVVEKTELQKSSELKWKMQNELAAEKARRELEVLRQNDLSEEVKKYRAKVRIATERNLVAIEKTHATLVASGNVPDAFHGNVHTVVDGEIVGEGVHGDCTISPDSSASLAEYRIVQKENADLRDRLEKMSALTGIPVEHVYDYDKQTWTDNAENEEKLDLMYPDGYGKTPHPFHENKFAVVRCSY